MKRVILAVALLASPLFGESVQKLVVLKYVDPQAVHSLLSMFGANVKSQPELRAIAISADKDKWPAIEEALTRLDVPASAPRNLEVSVAFILGSNKAALEGSQIPADLQPVVAQLKSAFALKEYRLADSLSLRMRVGQVADTSGQIAGGATPIITMLKVRVASVTAEGTVHFDLVNAGMRSGVHNASTNKLDFTETGVNTEIDVKDGQKVVVGKYSVEGPEKAMFLVLTAKVLP